MELVRKRNLFDSDADFEAFDRLAGQVFGLSFAAWRRAGCGRSSYFPYTLFDGEKAVANVSASTIRTLVCGRPRLYIQLGTVMTRPDYRGLGLARRLMNEALNDWENRCDGIYLYANSSAFGFYPKFGFVEASEYRWSKPLLPASGAVSKLDLAKAEDLALFRRCYGQGEPFSARPLLQNFDLVLFYCLDFLKDSVFYFPDLQAAAVAVQERDELLCYGLFGGGDTPMDVLLARLARPGTRRAVLGFMPQDQTGCSIEMISNDDRLFVLGRRENPFVESPMRMPLLSHT